MKTPKPAQEKQKNLAASAGGKVAKNKDKGKNQPGKKLDAATAKLGLQKAKETVKLQDGKNLQKKNEMKNKVFNGKGSPINGTHVPNTKGNKKRKSNEGVKPEAVVNEKKSKKVKGVAKSPEVQLGLKIEKLLESPKGDEPGKKNKKKGKKGASGAPDTTPKAPSPAGGSPAQGKRKRKGKGKKAGGSPLQSPAVPAVTPQKTKQPAAPPKSKADKPDWDKPIPLGNFPTRPNAENAVKALLKNLKEQKTKKPALLDEYEPLLVCVDFFKHPQSKRITRALLPHQILGDNPDIIFVVTDHKKAKKDFEESIEKHKELFQSRGVTNISEFIPWRKLCTEYTQFEEKRKLANRADAFLIDSKLVHRWPALLRKKSFKRKAPTPVRIDGASDLKKNVEVALRKSNIIIGPNSLGTSPQFGNTKMNVKSLVDNLITIATVLCDESKFPGGHANIRQINIRSAKSEAFPVYVSTASPNSVETPKKNKKKREVVEGEVTTAGVTVAVHPGGRVQVKSKDKDDEDEHNTSPQKKKVKDEVDSEDDEDFDDESDDDSEIDASLLEKFKKANKASDDESSEDEEEIEKAEQEFLLALRKQQDALENEAQAKSKKAGKKAPQPVVKEEDDEDDDDDSDDDSDVPDLIPVKKSKQPAQQAKPQAQQAKKAKPAKKSPGGGKPGQNGLGKGKPGKAQPGKQAQSPKGGPGKKGPQGGKGNANQKGNNKGSPKAQQRYFNKAGKK